MSIRRHIIDVIATNGNLPVRFPSTRKLGEQFGVSQPTALRAVKDLIAEGFLEACKGGGTISRPANHQNLTSYKIFGLLTAQGQQSFDVYYFLALKAAVSLELSRRSQQYCTQDLYLESPSLLERQAKEASLAGLVLVDARFHFADYARKLKESGMPTASLINRFEGVSSVHFPLEECIQSILKKLFAEQRTHLLVIGWAGAEYVKRMTAGIESACREADVPPGQVVFLHDEAARNQEKLTELLEFGMTFEGVFFYPFQRSLYDLIGQKHDLQEQCRIVLDEFSAFDELAFTGDVLQLDLKSAAKTLVDDLLMQLENPEAPPVEEPISYQIASYRNGVPCPSLETIER
jgi:hypothetical protein